jgi:PAS domain S-box-containing protein
MDVLSRGILDLPERLLDALPAAICVCDADGVIVRYNRRAAEHWGRRPKLNDASEKFCGSYRLFTHDGGRLPHAESPMAEVLRGGPPVRDRELLLERPDGSRIVAAVNIERLEGDAGQIIGAVNCFQDITARKQAEQDQARAQRQVQDLALELKRERDRLRESEDQARALLDAQPAAIYRTDAAGRITYYNEAAADLWGSRLELGRAEFCGSWKLHWPDGRPMPHNECPMAEALRTKQPIRGKLAVAERPDGTRVRFMPHPTPLFDRQGALVGAVNMLVDVTERHRNEAELEAREQRFRALIEASAQIVWTTDPNGTVTEDSPSWRAYTGQTTEGWMGSGWLDVVHPQDRERVSAAWDTAIARGKSVPIEYRVRHVSGEWRWMLARAAPVRDASGIIREWVGMNIEITERKTAERAMRAQTRRFEVLNRFAAVVSSDLELDRIAQKVTETATKLSGARFGAFFYYPTPDRRDDLVSAIWGASKETAEKLGALRNTKLFEAALGGEGPIRADDIRCDGRYAAEMSEMGLPLASILAVPVGRQGKVDGVLFLSHPRSAIFTRATEEVVAGIAAHAAVAIDNAHLYQSDRRLASIVETSSDAIVGKDLNGVVSSWNRGAENMFGYTAEEMVGKPISILIPADRQDEETQILSRIRRGAAVEPYETIRVRKDGKPIHISLAVSPVKNSEGRIVGAAKIARDITERKLAQTRQQLLARELHHRTKNLFAVVCAVVSRSFAGKRLVADAEKAVLDRLHSLAQTHVMLVDKEWRGAELGDVVRAEMRPYEGRVTIEGPAVLLSAQAAQNFGLAVHELAANAAKYGALSNQAGRVSIKWSVDRADGHDRFAFHWQERDGPSVLEPEKRGFGSVVLEKVMAEYFRQSAGIEFATSGVSYTLSGPLSAITE